MAAAGRRVERIDQLALVGRHPPLGLVYRLAGQRMLAREPTVDLAGGGRAQVVALGGKLPLVPEGIGPRRHRLGFQGFELGKDLRRQLVRHDPLQVVLQAHDIDDDERPAVARPNLDRAAIGVRVDREVVRARLRHDGRDR
jgi:hypothetical protein